jgi:uncharacterized protein YajQ (UPF0234 family)
LWGGLVAPECEPVILSGVAAQHSFDVTTGVDLQEVDNAVNQALKEIAQRYDFKQSKCAIDFDRRQALVKLEADDDFRMKALLEVLQSKLVRRGVPTKNVNIGENQAASAGRVRKEITLMQGIPIDTARQIVKAFKLEKFKKVQIAIQGDQLRVSSALKDALQGVLAFLKSQDFGVELEFGNYR